MKILTVVHNLEKGGVQRAAQNFAEAYNNLGNDSRVLCAYRQGIRQEELKYIGIKVYYPLNNIILKDIAEWCPDVIHIHSHGIKDDDIIELKNFCPDALFIETNVFSMPTSYSNLLTFSYQLSDWCEFLYISRGGKKTISRVVPNPVKTQLFFRVPKKEVIEFKKQYNIPIDSFVFGRIGQPFIGKWSTYLIDLFEKFLFNVDNKAILLIVNPPSELVNYIHNKPKIKRNIVIIKELIGDNLLRACYSAIDVFLHIATQGESFGMVLTESLLCETPVITLSTPWGDNSQCEVIGYEVGGKCVKNLKEFYSYMVKFYWNKNFLCELGKKARKHIIEKYDYLKVAQHSLDLIENDKNSSKFKFKKITKTVLPFKFFSLPLLYLKLKFAYNKKIERIINKLLRILGGYYRKI